MVSKARVGTNSKMTDAHCHNMSGGNYIVCKVVKMVICKVVNSLNRSDVRW